MCKKVRPLCTALTFRLVSWPVKHHMLHTIKHKSYSKANCFGMFGEQSIRISKTWHTVPLHLPAKSPGRSIQPCKHPQLRLQNFSNLYVTDKWLVFQICHFSDLAKFGNIEEDVCRFFGISLQSEDNNQITIEGNTAWAISEALGPRPSLGGECQWLRWLGPSDSVCFHEGIKCVDSTVQLYPQGF